MNDPCRTQEQLIAENEALRRRVAALEVLETQRRQTDQALRESEAELQRVLSSVSDYLWSATVDPAGN